MKLQELLSTAGDTMTVRRVFADPYEKDGITIIPGATVAGGGGGGSGHDEKGQEGEGGGFGMNAKPAGAFVIKSGRVTWRPAIDANRLLMMIGAVTLTAILTRRRHQRRRQRATKMRQVRMMRRAQMPRGSRMMRAAQMWRGDPMKGGGRMPSRGGRAGRRR